MSIQDKVDDDLKRFMYDEPPENINELGTALRGRFVSADSVENGGHNRVRVRNIRFAAHLKNEISKSKPSDVRRRRGLFMYGMAFFLLAIAAAITLPSPINWVMATGCFVPMILSAFVMVKRNRAKRKHVERR